MRPEIYPERCSSTHVSAIFPALCPPLPLVVFLFFCALRLPLLLFLVLTVQQLLQVRQQPLLLLILSCLQEQNYRTRFTLVIASHRLPQSLSSLGSCHISIILAVITSIAWQYCIGV
jgi:hypothetical protein